MIEPTDEMRRAGAQAIADADLADNNGTPEEYAEPVIRAVLAIVERDYVVVARDEAEDPYLDGGPHCECPQGADIHTANCPRRAWVLERQRRWAAP